MLSVIGKLPSISILLTTGLFCFFASCDSGDIHESEYIHDEGVTLSATFRLNYPELYPDDYNFTFGAFTETGNSPLVSVNLPRSDDEGNVGITLENIPEEATRIRLCFTDMGRQVKYTFFEQTIDRTSSGDIILPEKEIDLLEYNRIQQLVFQQYNCVSCHQGTSGSANLLLTEGESYRQLVNHPSTRSEKLRVVPYEPDSSFLLDVVTQSEVISYPHTGLITRNDDLELLRFWIGKGCPEN